MKHTTIKPCYDLYLSRGKRIAASAIQKHCRPDEVSACDSSRWEAVNQSVTTRIWSDNETEQCVTKRNELFSDERPEQTVSAYDSSRWEAVNQSITTRIVSDNETEQCVTKRNALFSEECSEQTVQNINMDLKSEFPMLKVVHLQV